MAESAIDLEVALPNDETMDKGGPGSYPSNGRSPQNNGNAEEAKEEHPDAPKIRRQVEFYFSDENLPTDLHLLQCCGGRENLPVSINRICGFKKMRCFKPKSIVTEALRESTFLEVTSDGKQVRRKVPLVGKCLLDPDYNEQDEDNEIAYDPRTKRPVYHPVLLLSQEKKVCPPGMTKGMMKPTGFEDTYVEGPLTPAEAEEELAMYDPDKPFIERIEIAIQRFKQKRRMHEMYSKIFNKWMRFGGVESDPRMFGGLSSREMADMTAEEIAIATATHHVPNDRTDKKKWVVDFVGVGEAFLSSFYPAHFSYGLAQLKTACQVLRSFYNYLMFHQVCDEYRPQLLLARALCDKAESELPKVGRACEALPGAFNVAASTIFGGSHRGLYTGTSEWAKDSDNTAGIGMRDEEAMVTFKTAVAVHGTDKQYDLLDSAGPSLTSLKIESSESLDLEITAIEYASPTAREAYIQQNKTWTDKIRLSPLGKLTCELIALPDFNVWDLPRDKYPNNHPYSQPSAKEFTFWIEDSVLDECFVGMKLSVQVLTLEGGILILDDIRGVMCSFYKYLPNELLMERKTREFKLMPIKGLDDFGVVSEGNGGEQHED